MKFTKNYSLFILGLSLVLSYESAVAGFKIDHRVHEVSNLVRGFTLSDKGKLAPIPEHKNDFKLEEKGLTHLYTYDPKAEGGSNLHTNYNQVQTEYTEDSLLKSIAITEESRGYVYRLNGSQLVSATQCKDVVVTEFLSMVAGRPERYRLFSCYTANKEVCAKIKTLYEGTPYRPGVLLYGFDEHYEDDIHEKLIKQASWMEQCDTDRNLPECQEMTQKLLQIHPFTELNPVQDLAVLGQLGKHYSVDEMQKYYRSAHWLDFIKVIRNNYSGLKAACFSYEKLF